MRRVYIDRFEDDEEYDEDSDYDFDDYGDYDDIDDDEDYDDEDDDDEIPSYMRLPPPHKNRETEEQDDDDEPPQRTVKRKLASHHRDKDLTPAVNPLGSFDAPLNTSQNPFQFNFPTTNATASSSTQNNNISVSNSNSTSKPTDTPFTFSFTTEQQPSSSATANSTPFSFSFLNPTTEQQPSSSATTDPNAPFKFDFPKPDTKPTFSFTTPTNDSTKKADAVQEADIPALESESDISADSDEPPALVDENNSEESTSEEEENLKFYFAGVPRGSHKKKEKTASKPSTTTATTATTATTPLPTNATVQQPTSSSTISAPPQQSNVQIYEPPIPAEKMTEHDTLFREYYEPLVVTFLKVDFSSKMDNTYFISLPLSTSLLKKESTVISDMDKIVKEDSKLSKFVTSKKQQPRKFYKKYYLTTYQEITEDDSLNSFVKRLQNLYPGIDKIEFFYERFKNLTDYFKKDVKVWESAIPNTSDVLKQSLFWKVKGCMVINQRFIYYLDYNNYYNEKGNAKYRVNNFDKAQYCYTESSFRYPYILKGHSNRSIILFSQKRYKECIAECDIVLEKYKLLSSNANHIIFDHSDIIQKVLLRKARALFKLAQLNWRSMRLDVDTAVFSKEPFNSFENVLQWFRESTITYAQVENLESDSDDKDFDVALNITSTFGLPSCCPVCRTVCQVPIKAWSACPNYLRNYISPFNPLLKSTYFACDICQQQLTKYDNAFLLKVWKPCHLSFAPKNLEVEASWLEPFMISILFRAMLCHQLPQTSTNTMHTKFLDLFSVFRKLVHTHQPLQSNKILLSIAKRPAEGLKHINANQQIQFNYYTEKQFHFDIAMYNPSAPMYFTLMILDMHIMAQYRSNDSNSVNTKQLNYVVQQDLPTTIADHMCTFYKKKVSLLVDALDIYVKNPVLVSQFHERIQKSRESNATPTATSVSTTVQPIDAQAQVDKAMQTYGIFVQQQMMELREKIKTLTEENHALLEHQNLIEPVIKLQQQQQEEGEAISDMNTKTLAQLREHLNALLKAQQIVNELIAEKEKQEARQLEQELQKLKLEMTVQEQCAHCKAKIVTKVALIPCGHTVCSHCITNVKKSCKCPFCSKWIVNSVSLK